MSPIKPSQHLFIIDPIETLNVRFDTTIKLAYCLAKLHSRVFVVYDHALSLMSHPLQVTAKAQELMFNGKHYEFQMGPERHMALQEFKTVHMRKEPPYDTKYLETLWLLSAARERTLIVNDPLALERYNEKLMISDFESESTRLMVSSDPTLLHDFTLTYCEGDIVVKPLNLFGGRGVVRLNSSETLFEDLSRETNNGRERRLVQKFEPKISSGEVRVFTACGHAVSWCLKVPETGNFLANTRAGSAIASYEPSAEELAVVERVAETLMLRGIFLAGFDIINGKISEINITCPALLGLDRESTEGVQKVAQHIVKLTENSPNNSNLQVTE